MKPMYTMQPSTARQSRPFSRYGAPTQSRMTSTPFPCNAQGCCVHHSPDGADNLATRGTPARRAIQTLAMTHKMPSQTAEVSSSSVAYEQRVFCCQCLASRGDIC